MKKAFEFKSSYRDSESKKNRTTSGGTNDQIHIRRRLYRQSKSCPHYSHSRKSLTLDTYAPLWSPSSAQVYYLRSKPDDLLPIELLLGRVKQFQGNEFIYLNYAAPEDSNFFGPYSFKEVEYSRVGRTKYFTISRHGFTVWSRAECLFTPLNVWSEEYRKYSHVSKVKVFATFRLWKTFTRWIKLIRRQKFTKNKNSLAKILVLAQPKLSDAIEGIRKVCEEIQNVQLFQLDAGRVWNLAELVEHQICVYQEASVAIEALYTHVTLSIDNAATAFLKSKGFHIEQCEYDWRPMKFVDRINKERTSSLISRYLRYVDYMIMSILFELVIVGSKSFLDIVERCNISHNSSALLSIKILLVDQQIFISPSQDEVEDSLKMIIDKSINLVQLKRFQENPLFLKFTRPIIGETKVEFDVPGLEHLFCVDNRLVSNRTRIISLITDTFDNLFNYLNCFKNHLLAYSTDLQTNQADLEKLCNVQELRSFCQKYSDQMKDIKDIEPFKKFGIFELDQRCFNYILTPLYRRLYDTICSRIPQLLENLLTEANDICQEIMGTLLSPPEGTLGFVNYIYFINRCESVFMDVTAKLSAVEELLELISIYKIEAEADLWKRYKTVSEFLLNCKDSHLKKLNQKETFVEKLSTNIDKDVYQVYQEVSLLKAEVTNKWILSEDSRPTIVKETLSNALEQLQTTNEKLVQLQSYCEAMSLPYIDLTVFVETQMDAQIRLNLWQSLEEWTNSIQEWYMLNFNQLNLDQMRSISTKILENCLVFSHALPENVISTKLEASVKLFKEKIDIIYQLQNETLKERHWNIIEELVNRKIVKNDSITIKDFEEAGLFEEKIAQKLLIISADAREEQLLEEALSTIECFWVEFHLKLIPHRYHRNIFILENADKVAQHLDDSFVKIGLIRSSRYVEPIRDRVEKWEIHLEVSTKTLVEWVNCQSNWCRLEFLFSIPGIEFQIPEELKLFNVIHSAWKETMCEANENSLALVALLKTGRLETFQECNLKIQDLTNRMDRFLNSRRFNFPRLYFLSQLELLTILTEEPRNVQQLSRFMPKIFDSVFKLKVKSTDYACLLEPVFTVTHIVSEIGQEVSLIDGVKIDGTTDQWLEVLEKEMINTVKEALKIGFESYDSNDVIEWGKAQLPQVTLIITQLKIFERIEEYFSNHDSAFENEINELTEYLKMGIQSRPDGGKLLDLYSVFNVVGYYKELLQRIKSGLMDNFKFNQVWRYKWQHDAPVTFIGDYEIPYFNEFISQCREFIFSEATERIIWYFHSIIKIGLNCLVSGPKTIDKTSSIRMFAKLVGKFIITFQCNSEISKYEDFKRTIFGVVRTGCWCIYNNIDMVDNKLLSVMGDQLMLVNRAKIENRIHIELTGEKIRINPWSQFFFISNRFEVLPKNMSVYLRSITLHLPDYEYLGRLHRITNFSGDLFCKEEDIISKLITIFHGPSGSGKTKAWMTYIEKLKQVHSDQIDFKQIFINSLPVEQLYGYYDSKGNWVDGFFEKTFRTFYKVYPITGRLFIILDGEPKDSWMNILRGIDERRSFVTLPNLTFLRIPERVSIVIECAKLEGNDIDQHVRFMSTIKCSNLNPKTPSQYFKDLLLERQFDEIILEHLLGLFEKYFYNVSAFSSNCISHQTINASVNVMFSLIIKLIQKDDELANVHRIFIFSILWSLGGAVNPSQKIKIEEIIRDLAPQELLPQESLWDICYCSKSKSFQLFQSTSMDIKITASNISMDTTFSHLESSRIGSLIKLMGNTIPILLVDSSRDFTIEITNAIEKQCQELQISISQVFLCAGKSSETIQEELERVLIPRRKQSIGPAIKSRHLYIIGDIYQSDSKEDFTEFLRQLNHLRGFYDRATWNLTKLLDVGFVGVTTKVSESMKRLTEQCFIIAPVSSPVDYFTVCWEPVLERITSQIATDVKSVVLQFLTVLSKLWRVLEKKNPGKCYLNAMKRILVGVLQDMTVNNLNDREKTIRLFQYEINRVLGDSVGSTDNREALSNNVRELLQETFSYSFESVNLLLFSNINSLSTLQASYEEVADLDRLRTNLIDYLIKFNLKFETTHELFWHNHLIYNLIRVCGLVRLPHFHGCIIGGASKEIICKLVAFINGFQLVKINSSSPYESIINNLLVVTPSDKILLLISHVQEINCLRAISDLLDTGMQSVNAYNRFGKSIKTQINILLLYDSDELANSVLLQFPTLQRYCQKYYFPFWSTDEYKFIAMQLFEKLKVTPSDLLADLVVRIQGTLIDSQKSFESSSQKFLHLVQIYEWLFKSKKTEVFDKLVKVRSCRKSLIEIKEKMASDDLLKFLPQLEDRKRSLKKMRSNLDHIVTNCEEIRLHVVLEESFVKIQTASTSDITDDVNTDLEIAMPALRAAQDQIKSLSKGDWSELRGQNNPAKLVVFVHEAVCILFKLKPDWPTARALINDPNILNKILDFDKENVSEMVSKKLKAYIDSKDFDPAKIERVSKVSKCLCMWMKAIDQFVKVYKIVEPKVRNQQNAESSLRHSMIELRRKQQELADAESKMQTLRDEIEEYNSSYRYLQENVDLINLRLARANRVTTALAEEDILWSKDIIYLEALLNSLATDVLFTSATIAYLGRYSANDKKRLINKWIGLGVELNLNVSKTFKLKNLLKDDLQVLKWHSMGLPKCEISLENALIWKHSLRYPFVIDCHSRMTQWILNDESDLHVLHHKQRDLRDQLKVCLKTGKRVLIKEITNPVNDLLLLILQGTVVYKSEALYLQLESEIVPFNSKFFMYLITRQDAIKFDNVLPNVNVIHCEVSEEGNKQQILTSISEVELQAMRSQSKEVQIKIEEDCWRMRNLQEAIVTYLHESKGCILDDAELVSAIYETKETYSVVVDRLADTRESEKVLLAIKKKYQSIAEFAIRLLRTVDELKILNPLYEVSMQVFVDVFARCVLKLEDDNIVPEVNQNRIKGIIKEATRAVFNLIKPRLCYEDQVCVAMQFLFLLNGAEVTNDVNLKSVGVNLGVKLLSNIDLNETIHRETHPIFVLPQNECLEELISDLRQIQGRIVRFISAGVGNEEVVLQTLEKACKIGHIVILQNLHLNQHIVRYIEELFADGIVGDRLKLVVVVGDASEIPSSILYSSCVLAYYGQKTVQVEDISMHVIKSRYNEWSLRMRSQLSREKGDQEAVRHY